MSNQDCKIRPALLNINSSEPLSYPYHVLVNKCNSSCNVINNACAKLCVPEVVKNINIKVFNLILRINEMCESYIMVWNLCVKM